ncbi:MAG: cytochrome c-type biogenesis protein CcmH [Methylocystaceae bacterium]|nr:MAG: cytochrome c-type biogenesis protein CcmH [Methylocystaceae bacterium]
MKFFHDLGERPLSRSREKVSRECATDEGSPGPHSSRLRRAALSRRRERGARFISAFLLCLALLTPAASFAVAPGEVLADPKLETRARAIASELRCLVCQNQSIDDSDAPLAKDLRLIVREKLKEGASDADVRAFVVSRYGDFVLLRPPVKPETWLLWAAPLLALLGGAWAILAAARRSRRQSAPGGLTEAERAQLQALGVAEPPPQPSPASRERD